MQRDQRTLDQIVLSLLQPCDVFARVYSVVNGPHSLGNITENENITQNNGED